MTLHPDAHPGRKIIAQAAAARAARELLDGAVLANHDGPILTMRNPRQANFRWMHSPEVDLLDYDCDIPAPELRKLAKARFEARMARKAAGRARYQRRHGQWCRNVYKDPWPGITGNRPSGMILDDPHAEMPTEEQRASMVAWHERHLHAPR